MTLEVRPRKDGTPVYSYRFFWRKQKYRGYIGPVSKKTAQRVERQMKVRVAEGRYAAEAAPPPPTLDAVAERFLAWFASGSRPKSYRSYELRLRCHLRPSLGHRRLDEITTAVLDDYRLRRRQEGAAPRTVNADLLVLSSLLSKAREWGLLSEGHHPRLGLLRTDETTIRVLSAEDEAALLREAKLPLRRVILFALHTGLRRDELSTLTWPQIDWEHREVVVTAERAKSRRARRIPLNGVTLAILAELRAQPIHREARVFGYRHWACSFDRACKRAGLPGIHPHTLRHTFATRALEAGVNVRTVQRWLGHAKLTTTEIYMHPSREYDHQAIRALEGPGGDAGPPSARQPRLNRHVNDDGGRLLLMSAYRARHHTSAAQEAGLRRR